MQRQTVLHNGIRILTERIPHIHSVTVGYWVDSGSRHDPSDKGGLSHLVEHMLFKGTSRRSSGDIALAMDLVGGVLNAFTAREYTCYYAKVLGSKLDEALDLLSDLYLRSLFNPEDIDRERRVILQEIGMVEDTPDDNIHDLWATSFWLNQAIGLPVIGTGESVAGIDRQDVCDYVASNYCGRRLVVAAAGAIHHDDFVRQIERQLGALPAGEKRPAAAPPTIHAGLQLHERDLEQVHFCLGVPALSYSAPDRFVQHLFNLLLGGSMGSRLFQEVREKRGLAYSIYSYLNSHTDSGALNVYAGTRAAEAATVLQLIRDQFLRLQREQVSECELRAAKEQLKGNLLLSLESSDNRMSRLAKNEILLGQHLEVEKVVALIEEVTAPQIQQLAVRLLADETVNLQLMGPLQDCAPAIRAIFPDCPELTS